MSSFAFFPASHLLPGPQLPLQPPRWQRDFSSELADGPHCSAQRLLCANAGELPASSPGCNRDASMGSWRDKDRSGQFADATGSDIGPKARTMTSLQETAASRDCFGSEACPRFIKGHQGDDVSSGALTYQRAPPQLQPSIPQRCAPSSCPPPIAQFYDRRESSWTLHPQPNGEASLGPGSSGAGGASGTAEGLNDCWDCHFYGPVQGASAASCSRPQDMATSSGTLFPQFFHPKNEMDYPVLINSQPFQQACHTQSTPIPQYACLNFRAPSTWFPPFHPLPFHPASLSSCQAPGHSLHRRTDKTCQTQTCLHPEMTESSAIQTSQNTDLSSVPSGFPPDGPWQLKEDQQRDEHLFETKALTSSVGMFQAEEPCVKFRSDPDERQETPLFRDHASSPIYHLSADEKMPHLENRRPLREKNPTPPSATVPKQNSNQEAASSSSSCSPPTSLRLPADAICFTPSSQAAHECLDTSTTHLFCRVEEEAHQASTTDDPKTRNQNPQHSCGRDLLLHDSQGSIADVCPALAEDTRAGVSSSLLSLSKKAAVKDCSLANAEDNKRHPPGPGPPLSSASASSFSRSASSSASIHVRAGEAPFACSSTGCGTAIQQPEADLCQLSRHHPDPRSGRTSSGLPVLSRRHPLHSPPLPPQITGAPPSQDDLSNTRGTFEVAVEGEMDEDEASSDFAFSHQGEEPISFSWLGNFWCPAMGETSQKSQPVATVFRPGQEEVCLDNRLSATKRVDEAFHHEGHQGQTSLRASHHEDEESSSRLAGVDLEKLLWTDKEKALAESGPDPNGHRSTPRLPGIEGWEAEATRNLWTPSRQAFVGFTGADYTFSSNANRDLLPLENNNRPRRRTRSFHFLVFFSVLNLRITNVVRERRAGIG